MSRNFQEPVLFSGTMRKNLDPFDNYPDELLMRALQNVELQSEDEGVGNITYSIFMVID